MDPKELRANAPLSISLSDDSTKYVHSSPTLPGNKSKSYHEIGSNSMGKVDAMASRPCAIIGPDRVLTQTSSDVYLKKAPVEPWPCSDNSYRQPPDYPNKLSEYPPIRNISPRQTFQENMQRVMVPPTYNSIKNSDESSLKNSKLNMPQEAKYCDVPYNMNSVTNELKSVRNPDIPMSSVNPAYSRAVPHYGWPAGVSIRPPRPYGAPEIYQYQEYPGGVGPRPVTIPHPHRVHREEAAQVYSERFYQEANIRFKPYPVLKEKHQQTRYDYINNYQNNFHPPVSFPPHKYDLQKPIHPHAYPVYSQVPIKYLDRRVHESFVDGYQRSNQQPNFNPQFHNQVIHPPYGPSSGNCIQNKSFTDLSAKAMAANKLPYEANNKIYLELDTSRNKGYPMPENVYYNEINHTQHMRNEILLQNHSSLNMHSMPQHQIYRRENIPLKHYEYNVHHRNLDQSVNLNYSLPRIPLQFSPNTVAISPSDSNTSNDTGHTVGTAQEDCGYVSQSSTNSARSLDANSLSVHKDRYRRHDYNNQTIQRNVLHINNSEKNSKNKTNSSSKKNIDVRQFLQMWNEGEDEASESNKEIVTQIHQNNFSIPPKTPNNQEQLYVLGLVNVPSEELSKYEHIQKISKLPENIKGYNNIELLNQYEELLESPHNNNYKNIQKVHKDHNLLSKRPNDKEIVSLPRPVSPLDVEAKISQSVIHKEVGCNFEIKPCSPEMLNVEVATPIQSILGERIIEKVANPNANMSKSPRLSMNDDNRNHSNIKIASCDMINTQYTVNNYANGIKNNHYNVQDFDSNSGICLASLPRLDNDIELNFPEINQQFIKANKIESDSHLFQKDLVQLNLDQVSQERNNFQQNSNSPSQFCLGAPEKEFSKLSKYRKSKKCDLMPKEDIVERSNVGTAQQRINSVIIKNPDTKLPEDNNNSCSTANNTLGENINNNFNADPNSENLLNSLLPENNKMLSFDTAIDFSLNKTEETKSYDCLSKCTDEPDYFNDNDNINFTPVTVIDKEIISKEKPIELQIKEVKEIEAIEEVNINNQPIVYSRIEINDNNASISYDMTISDRNKENSIPVIQNISSITEMEEYANLQQNSSCDIIQGDDCIGETSTVLETVNKENINNNQIYTTIPVPDVISDKVEKCLEKNLETIELEVTLDSHEEGVESKNDTIIANENKCDDVDKRHIILETEAETAESKNITAVRENSTTETVLSKITKNKIDEGSILQNATSVESNKNIELSGVFDEIKEIVNSTENKNLEEEKVLMAVNADIMEIKDINEELEQFQYVKSCPIDLQVNYKTDDYTVISKNNDSLLKDSNQDTNMIETKMSDLSTALDSSESSSNCEKQITHTSLNNDGLKSSENNKEELSELSDQDEEKNCNKEELVSCTNINNENLEVSQVISANKEKENINNDELSPKLKITKSVNNPYQERKYDHFAKELYSPRIQKLITFHEGVCKVIPNNDDCLKTTEKRIEVDTSDETLNENDIKESKDIEMKDVVQNDVDDVIDFSESCSNEEQKINCDPIDTQIDGKDLTKSPEDEIIPDEEDCTKKTNCVSFVRRNVLKRSLSESALGDYEENENHSVFSPTKRKKRNHNIINPVISEELCSIIQTNRRNSISTFYNEENVFILIDNDIIITEEQDDAEKMYYTEIPDDLSNNISQNDSSNNENSTLNTEMVSDETNQLCEYSDNLNFIEEKTVEESWVEDVACIETVVSDDITDDIDYDNMSPKKNNIDDETTSDDSAIFCDSKHIDKIKDIYGNNMCSNDTQILQTLYMTPQMNVNKTLVDIESHSSVKYQDYNETLDLSPENEFVDKTEEEISTYDTYEVTNEKENISGEDINITKVKPNKRITDNVYVTSEYKEDTEKCIVHSCESNDDYLMSSTNALSSYSNSSSPEVSSTTSEEKNSSILLKITNHNGSRVSKINEIGSSDRLSYKLTEKKEYQNYNTNFSTSGTLITKAAQKYIPPLKESIRDLKIKLTLPQHRLHTLKQLQVSKVEPKIDNIIKYINNNTKQEKPKKPKPKFEDVLKSIDEIQFKKHKDKIKRGKNGIPKVVIKKNEDGAHYASSKRFDTNESYNPDLTGRKWQPWVFLEKNNFIDKMAIKKKVNAVYCHRKNNYVLAEKFRKYKSVYNANFVISQPSSDDSAKGTLKYTIRLKHK
ncbi:protein PFC0760c-like [Vanessa cardui]|uniref:protein PFC0760c-like n=1 Tax=Vanessa cardui TaxID=171605 RepID=UPI001F147631|nr:protein PFC0760c-like [Vanessa cardui]